MRVRLNKAHFPVTVLGPGRRIGLWFQGCRIQCSGCVSQDTWDSQLGNDVEIDAVLDWCRSLAAERPTGITITGGEPFDQPAALATLLDGLSAWREDMGAEVDLLCYSGYSLAALRKRNSELLRKLDVVIPGQFVAGMPPTIPLTGSSNQRIIRLSPLGNRRYAANNIATASPKRLQVTVDDGSVWIIGIPRRGDLDTMAAACGEHGVLLKGLSWRA